MTRAAIGLMLLAPLLLIQACSATDRPSGRDMRKVTVHVEGMKVHNGMLCMV